MITCKFIPGQIFIEINVYKSVQAYCKKKKKLNHHIVAPANSNVGRLYVNLFRTSCSLTPCKGVLQLPNTLYNKPGLFQFINSPRASASPGEWLIVFLKYQALLTIKKIQVIKFKKFSSKIRTNISKFFELASARFHNFRNGPFINRHFMVRFRNIRRKIIKF